MKRVIACGLLLLSGPTAAGPTHLASGIDRGFSSWLSVVAFFVTLAGIRMRRRGRHRGDRLERVLPVNQPTPAANVTVPPEAEPGRGAAEAYKGTAAK
jgi:hypothetical protein